MSRFGSSAQAGFLLANARITYLLSTAPDPDLQKSISESLPPRDGASSIGNATRVRSRSGNYLVFARPSSQLQLTLYKYISENQLIIIRRRYLLLLSLFTSTAGIVILLFSRFTHRLVSQPLNELSRAFKIVENGDLGISIRREYDDEFRDLYEGFNLMVVKLRQLLDNVYKLKILSQRAELKQMQAQINPHFLFNSLFALHNMIDYDEKSNVQRFLQELGNYFRFLTRSSGDFVSLSEEINHAKTYAEIQGRRFRNRIAISFDPPSPCDATTKVPRQIVQPVIENAIEHGLKNTVHGGIIRVVHLIQSDRLRIEVDDNGSELDDVTIEAIRTGLSAGREGIECTGLVNIHRRIQICYGPECGVTVSRSELGGLHVALAVGIGEVSGSVPDDRR
jgi:two-component system sensor histidine kinase YesM